MSNGNKTDNGVLEIGTEECRLSYQQDTPGQEVEKYLAQVREVNEAKKKKAFNQVFQNPLKGFPYNEQNDAKSIAKMTGTREKAVQQFIDSNDIQGEKLLQKIKKDKKLAKDFAMALSGKPGNKMMKQFTEETVSEAYSKNTVIEQTEVTEGREKGPRAFINPNKEVMVVKKNKVIVIDKKDQDKYLRQGWILAEDIEEVLDEGKMGDLFLDIQQGATAKDLAKDYPVSLAQAKEFLKDYYGQKKGPRKEEVEQVEEGKYAKYSDLLIKKAKLVAQGPIASKEVADVNKQIASEMKKLGVKEETLNEVSIGDAGIQKDFPNVWAQKDKRMNKILIALVNLHGFMDNLKSYKKDKKKFVDSLKRIGKNDASLKKAGLTKRNLGEDIQEGTWKLPKSSKEQKQLKDLMKKPFIMMKGRIMQFDKISSLIGDDSLLDDLHDFGKKNPTGDARPIIKQAMKRLGIKEEVSEGKMDGSKLTGAEISAYFRRHPVRDKTVKKGVEFALDHGGAMSYAIKGIEKMKKGLSKHKDVKKALNIANYGTEQRVSEVGFMFKEDSPIAGDIQVEGDQYIPQKKGVNKNIANYWKKLGFKSNKELEAIQSMYMITDHNGVVQMYKAGKRDFEKSVRSS